IADLNDRVLTAIKVKLRISGRQHLVVDKHSDRRIRGDGHRFAPKKITGGVHSLDNDNTIQSFLALHRHRGVSRFQDPTTAASKSAGVFTEDGIAPSGRGKAGLFPTPGV